MFRQSIETARKGSTSPAIQARPGPRIGPRSRCSRADCGAVSRPRPAQVILTDMPAAVGGGGSAPTPGWLLRPAHPSCDATMIAMRAAEFTITLHRLEVTVGSPSDDR